MGCPDWCDIDRRRFLELGGKGALALGLGSTAPALAAAGPRRLDVSAIGEEPLRRRARGKNLLFGTALGRRQLKDEKYGEAVARDCNIIVPENELKWRHLHKNQERWGFKHADKMLDFARRNGMAMRGHTLVWHNSIPGWANEVLRRSPGKFRNLMVEHIRTVAGRYAGEMHSWDVVNEPMEPMDGRSDGLRESPFLNAIGPEYISLAFRTAAEADPDAMLVLNDYGLEWGWDVGKEKRRKTLALLERLLVKDVPVHAYGIQGHLDPGSDNAIDLPALAGFCKEIADLGLKILVTELDARDTKIDGSLRTRDQEVAKAYAGFLDVVLDQPVTVAVLVWGLSDDYSWLQTHNPRADGKPVRGTPFDANREKKLAWYAIASAIDNATPRPD